MNIRPLFALPFLPLALSMVGCNTTPSLSSFKSQAILSGAEIDVTIERVYSKDTGLLKYINSQYVLKQPSLSFITQAGSIGGRLVSADITVNDESGNRYGDVSGQYSQAIGQLLLQGYACKAADGTLDPAMDTNTCTFNNKVEYTRQQIFPGTNNASSIQLLAARIGEFATDDCVNGPCPANLTMNVTFNVIDDLNRAQTIQVTRAPIAVYRVSDTRSEQ